jgi:probable HAF family extracellular repeat protein
MQRAEHKLMQGTIGRCALVAVAMSSISIAGTAVSAAEVRYRVLNLQSTAPAEVLYSEGRGINRHGDVVGSYWLPGDIAGRPFVYRDGSGFVPFAHVAEFFGWPQGINDKGQVAVYGFLAGTESPTSWRYTPGVGYESLGTLGEEGDIRDVPADINMLGQVVGRSDTYFEGAPWQDAFLYTDGVGMVNLGHLPNRYSSGRGINDLGQITGSSGGYAFLYTKGTGMVSIGQGVGYDINNRGVVAGKVGWQPPYQAAIYVGGTTRLLTTPDVDCQADAINEHNVVVGQIFDNPQRIFVWTERDGLMELNSLIEPGWNVLRPSGINDNGQIAAVGTFNGAYTAAVRLDPIPPRLSIQRGSTHLMVSWSPNWPGLVLECTDELSAPNWQPLPSGGTNMVILPLTGASRFFRLNLDGIRGLCCAPEK